MKPTKKFMFSVLALGASTLLLLAEGEGQPPRPPQGKEGRGLGGPGHHLPPPVMVVLDANHDGVIDATEIANASQALLALDKDGDGQLTREELRPPHPEGRTQAFQPEAN